MRHTWDAMQVGLNCNRVEGGQVALVGEDVLMCNDVQVGMIHVQPAGHLHQRQISAPGIRVFEFRV